MDQVLWKRRKGECFKLGRGNAGVRQGAAAEHNKFILIRSLGCFPGANYQFNCTLSLTFWSGNNSVISPISHWSVIWRHIHLLTACVSEQDLVSTRSQSLAPPGMKKGPLRPALPNHGEHDAPVTSLGDSCCPYADGRQAPNFNWDPLCFDLFDESIPLLPVWKTLILESIFTWTWAHITRCVIDVQTRTLERKRPGLWTFMQVFMAILPIPGQRHRQAFVSKWNHLFSTGLYSTSATTEGQAKPREESEGQREDSSFRWKTHSGKGGEECRCPPLRACVPNHGFSWKGG